MEVTVLGEVIDMFIEDIEIQGEEVVSEMKIKSMLVIGKAHISGNCIEKIIGGVAC